MYTIQIDYHTGDSFGSSEEVGEVGCVWKSKELARKALANIKEHYELYEEANNNHWTKPARKHAEIEKEVKTKSWYVDKYWQHSLLVEKDDGTMQQISSFWTGYFERLHKAEIIKLVEENSEDVYTP